MVSEKFSSCLNWKVRDSTVKSCSDSLWSSEIEVLDQSFCLCQLERPYAQQCVLFPSADFQYLGLAAGPHGVRDDDLPRFENDFPHLADVRPGGGAEVDIPLVLGAAQLEAWKAKEIVIRVLVCEFFKSNLLIYDLIPILVNVLNRNLLMRRIVLLLVDVTWLILMLISRWLLLKNSRQNFCILWNLHVS